LNWPELEQKISRSNASLNLKQVYHTMVKKATTRYMPLKLLP